MNNSRLCSAQREGLLVDLHELGLDALFDSGHPLVLGDLGEVAGETTHQHQVDGLGGACLNGEGQRVHIVDENALRLQGLQHLVGIGCRARDDGHGIGLAVVDDDAAALAEAGCPTGGLQLLKGNDVVGLALVDDGGVYAVAVADVGDHAAAALAHAVDLGHLDVVALLQQQSAQKLTGQQAALAADTNDHDIFGFHSSVLLCSGECAGLAELLADTAADTEGGIDLGLAADHADGGAADLHAHLAAYALIGVDFKTWDDEKYGLFEPSLWQTQSSGKYIGLDHEVALGANGISLSDYYANYAESEGSNIDGGTKGTGNTDPKPPVTTKPVATTSNKSSVPKIRLILSMFFLIIRLLDCRVAYLAYEQHVVVMVYYRIDEWAVKGYYFNFGWSH